VSWTFGNVREAAGMVQQITTWLLGAVPPTPTLELAALRTACGDVHAHADTYLIDATLPVELLNCFQLATPAGATFDSYEAIRNNVLALTPISVPAKIVADLGLWYTLGEECRCIAATSYVSRQDVAAAIDQVNTAFWPAEEKAADLSQGSFYLAVVSLHAATTRDLVARSLLLPNVVAFDFKAPMPTLWGAQRLYADGSRADQLRNENKVVHPAFMLPQGVCLSQ
jgi:hypothetical protein